jgi:hypothetical protein
MDEGTARWQGNTIYRLPKNSSIDIHSRISMATANSANRISSTFGNVGRASRSNSGQHVFTLDGNLPNFVQH